MPQRRACLLVELSVFCLGKGPCSTLNTEQKRLAIYTGPKEAALWVMETGTGILLRLGQKSWMAQPSSHGGKGQRREDGRWNQDEGEEDTLVILSDEQ